jgi:Na+/H+ antiporter NhaD/arsenite permease-like protein
MWLVGFVTFFLSALLDNLTTTIVMISLMRKLLSNHADRLFFAGIIVIAANAGGAWSPIGDVTTTMLWIGGQITTMNIILGVPALRGQPARTPGHHGLRVARPPVVGPEHIDMDHGLKTTEFERNTMFFLGLGILVAVPASRPSPICRPSWASCSGWASSGWSAT